MIRRAAPEGPLMMETIRLGVMAMVLVIKFLIHPFIFKSKKPCMTTNQTTNPEFSKSFDKNHLQNSIY